MPGPLRVEYEGAIYHVVNRGDRREDIFFDAANREIFLATLGGTYRGERGRERGRSFILTYPKRV